VGSRYTDTVYDNDSPTQQNRRAGLGGADDPYVSSRGFSSNEERLTSAALASAVSTPADLIRNTPPVRGVLFPQRFVGERTQPTITDIIQQGRPPRYPDSVEGIRDWSGSGGSYSGTSTPSGTVGA